MSLQSSRILAPSALLAHIIVKGVQHMSQIGEPLRIIEVEPLEEPVPEKEVPFEQPADPVKEPA